MHQKVKRPIFVVLITVFFITMASLGLKFYLTAGDVQIYSSSTAVSSSISVVSLNQTVSSIGSSVSSAAGTQQVISKIGMTKAELNVVDTWRFERGYFNQLENDDYKQYDEQTLKKLADGGDMRAAQLLADLLFGQHKFKDAVELYKKTALYGSTKSLQFLIGEEGRRSLIDESGNMNQTEEEKKNHVLTALAYAKVAEMRGDSDVYFRSLMAPTSANPSQIALTDEDYAKVQPLAREIYDDLQRQRNDLGLGSFDNSVPPEVVDGFKRIDPRIFNGIKAKY